jgi:hypothetical protein
MLKKYFSAMPGKFQVAKAVENSRKHCAPYYILYKMGEKLSFFVDSFVSLSS